MFFPRKPKETKTVFLENKEARRTGLDILKPHTHIYIYIHTHPS